MEDYEKFTLNVFKDKVKRGCFTMTDARWLLEGIMEGGVTAEFFEAIIDLVIESGVFPEEVIQGMYEFEKSLGF